MPEAIALPNRREPIRQAVAALDHAFFDDPLYAYLLPDPTQRKQLLTKIHLIILRYALRYGVVYTTPAYEGAACWLPPGETFPSLWRLLSVAWRDPPLALGWQGYRRYAQVGDYTERAHHNAVTSAHWYLWALGVDPAHQRQGIGGALLHPILTQADEKRLPCYLETSNEENPPFYERQGFRVVSEGIAPGTKLRMWAMRRN